MENLSDGWAFFADPLTATFSCYIHQTKELLSVMLGRCCDNWHSARVTSYLQNNTFYLFAYLPGNMPLQTAHVIS